MKFIFGWYSYELESFSAKDLGIEIEKGQLNIYEARQKCFHIFWIPCFPIRKEYVLIKDDKKYQPSSEIIELIKSRSSNRTPWVSFLLPIILLISFTISIIDNELPQYRDHLFRKAKYKYGITQIEKEISNLSRNHYIKIRNQKKRYSSQSLYLKFIEDDKDTILFSKIETGILDHEAYPFEIKDFYLKNFLQIDTVTISKKDLLKSICHDCNFYWQNKEFGQYLLGDNIKYLVEDVIYIDGPVIWGIASTYGPLVKDISKQKWNGEVKFHNYGENVDLENIENIEGEINWHNELPMPIKTDSTNKSFFILNGDNYTSNESYKIKLIFRDEKDNDYTYIVEGKNLDKQVERIY